MSTEREARHQINMRITDETRERLAALAVEDERTMARQLKWLIDQEWRRRGKDEGKKKK